MWGVWGSNEQNGGNQKSLCAHYKLGCEVVVYVCMCVAYVVCVITHTCAHLYIHNTHTMHTPPHTYTQYMNTCTYTHTSPSTT